MKLDGATAGPLSGGPRRLGTREENAVIGYIFFVAVLNLALGFGLACHVGRRYRRTVALAGTGRATGAPRAATPHRPVVSVPPPAVEPAMEEELLVAAASLAAEAAVMTTPESASDEPPPVNTMAEEAASAPAAGASSLDDAADQAALEAILARASAAAAPATAALPAVAQPVADDAAASPAQRSVSRLGSQVEQYQEQLTEIDQNLRQLSQAPQVEKIAACLATLSEANRDFAAQEEAIRHELEQAGPEDLAAAPVRQVLRSAVDVQHAQLASADRAIREFNYDGDLSAGCRKMVSEANKLLEVNHRLRDTLDEAGIVAAQAAGDAAPRPAARQVDALTGMLNRAGLEQTLRETLAGPSAAATIAVAILDLDHMGQINEHYGHRIGDGIVRAVARLLAAEKGENGQTARMAGSRFFVLFAEADVRTAANFCERLRQTVELTTFSLDDLTIRVTLSCAAASAVPGEGNEAVLGRAEAALREAKRYGRNRSFQHEGEYPTPVVPPNFALEPLEVKL